VTRIAVGFGSNLGDRRAHLNAGLASVARHARLIARSSLYESAPVGPVEQGSFLNAVAVFDSAREPAEILKDLLAIEMTRGRTREVRWGPRTLDLDLLLYGATAVDEEGLTVPHPELTSRRFVLQPLLEAWPEARLPNGTALAGFLEAVDDQEVERIGPWTVKRWKRLWWRLHRAAFRITGIG
jgi:2-amino-4-hydroxy-6-hydroxymethyldihydropteridine diphosphokinase